MELDDDSTYAVIVSGSGEAQIFKLGCVDNFRDSNELAMLVNRQVASASADAISKEPNHKVESPSVENHRPKTEKRSPHTCRKRKKAIARKPDTDETKIPQNDYESRRFHSARRLSDQKYRNVNQKNILPMNSVNIREVDDNDEETNAGGSINDNNSCSKNDNTQPKFFWTRTKTRALVDEYRAMIVDFRNPQRRQRDIWESLAKRLRRKGHAGITGDMCDRKWRNLKSTFKTIYNSNRQLYSKRRWEYYDELKILFAPDIGETRMEKKSRTIPSFSESSQQDETVLSEDISEDIKSGENSTGMLNEPEWFSKLLNSYRTGYETKIKLACEQHDKIMDIKHRACQLLERLIDTV